MITIRSQENSENHKQRNIFLTLYLSLFLIVDFYTLETVFDGDISNDIIFDNSDTINNIFISLTAIDFVLTLFLLKWKKWAFWGIVITSSTTFAINLYLNVGLVSFVGLLGALILFGLLQLKRKNISGWDNLE